MLVRWSGAVVTGDPPRFRVTVVELTNIAGTASPAMLADPLTLEGNVQFLVCP